MDYRKKINNDRLCSKNKLFELEFRIRRTSSAFRITINNHLEYVCSSEEINKFIEYLELIQQKYKYSKRCYVTFSAKRKINFKEVVRYSDEHLNYYFLGDERYGDCEQSSFKFYLPKSNKKLNELIQTLKKVNELAESTNARGFDFYFQDISYLI